MEVELEVCFIIYEVLEALAYLHKRGIMHRDIKPENIMLTFDGAKESVVAVKLIDFGLSVMLSPSRRSKDACGTPAYVAPEIVSKQGYTQQGDMWSLGVVTYMLFLVLQVP